MQYDRWHWHKDFLTCDLLAKWRHGFFSRAAHPQKPEELHQHLVTEGSAKSVKQVHGSEIIYSPDRDLTPADGLWSDRPNESIWVCSADCVPVLIGEQKLGMVMAIHAGWRGTAGGILAEGIRIFLTQGSSLGDLRIALGPAISGAVYQVGQDVAQQVTAILKHPVGVEADSKPNHCLLDIRAVQQQCLLELGIDSSQVAIAPYCTYQTPEYFFSYRRGDSKKVQWSGIMANTAVG